MISLARYATANALTRTMLGELLRPSAYEEIAGSESLQGAWSALRKTVYGEWLPEEMPGSIIGMEKLISDVAASRFRRSIRTLEGKPCDVARLLLCRWELDDLELALRIWHGKESELTNYLTFPCLVHEIPIYDLVEAESIEAVAIALRGTPYFNALTGAIHAYKARRSIFYVELELERDYYKRLVAATEELGGSDAKKARKIVGAQIDLVNVMLLSRLMTYCEVRPEDFARYAIPGPSEFSQRFASSRLTAEAFDEMRSEILGRYEESQSKQSMVESISMLESVTRRMAIEIARSCLMGYPFTIECVFAFYLLKRNEMENLKTVLSGKALGLTEGEIVRRLHFWS